ncbi:MAG: BREX-3 system phosphatase PglZ [Chloroflexota bacterium]|nr:BREX-3 system phosphatase PglZ [Chloroflexota bacterium]
MINTILQHFPANTHPLTLVSDPDALLGDEELLTTLAKRGFTIINEPDPIRQRHRYSLTSPPHIIITSGDLNQLPYDLWQQGQRVTLALHTFFPHLAYPLVQPLTSNQRTILAQSPPPPFRLSQRGTITYLFQHVFNLNTNALDNPLTLLNWLSQHHRQPDPLPQLLKDALLEKLSSLPVYADWPLADLISTPATFRDFIQEQWLGYLENQTGLALRETAAAYLLDFEQNVDVQDLLPRWLRGGWLSPTEIPAPRELPGWAEAGVLTPDGDHRLQRFRDLLVTVEESLPVGVDTLRWAGWQPLAWDWAELTGLHHTSDVELSTKDKKTYQHLQKQLDDAFLPWLRKSYSPLASKSLPQPHHLHHVPSYIAYQRRQGRSDKIALLILDGMALADWLIIQPVWKSRHTDWQMQSQLLLAQVPSITAVSRQALISGMRPAEFQESIHHNRYEPKHWKNFWARQDLSPKACQFERFRSRKGGSDSTLVTPRTRALCLIDNAIDDIIHKSSLGASNAQQTLRLWLKEHAQKLEHQIDLLLKDGFSIYLTSDHGHTESHGIRQPNEGLIVLSRGRRTRMYKDERLMNTVRAAFPETYVWHGDGLLPDDIWVLIPQGQRAFAPHEEIHVTHGGLSIDEIVVPLIEITLAEV